jgi:hypothetical protein
MPDPSFFPALLALGVVMLAIGALTTLLVVFGGLIVVLIGVFGWAFERGEH